MQQPLQPAAMAAARAVEAKHGLDDSAAGTLHDADGQDDDVDTNHAVKVHEGSVQEGVGTAVTTASSPISGHQHQPPSASPQ